MIARFFHRWERRLASVDTNRVVRPFEWGLDWLGATASVADPRAWLHDWARRAVATSDAFYDVGPADDYRLEGDRLTFSSAVTSPFPENDRVTARIFAPSAFRAASDQRAVVVLPQWNADASGHVGLCELLARFGILAVRLSLPYHDVRKPPDLERADYIVSANVGRTLHANRQAVLDTKRVIAWLAARGHRRIGVLGTSLGSCLALLAVTHDDRVRAAAFNHVSPYFADVVWRGISTRHVRQGLESAVTLDEVRDYWMPISPTPFVPRLGARRVLLIYARYDLSFPVDLSHVALAQFTAAGVPHDIFRLPCGHYTTGRAPFKFMDAYAITKYFLRTL